MCNSCLSVAKLSDFPNTSAAVDFDKYSTEFKTNKEPLWTTGTSNEYYFEKEKKVSEKELTEIIQFALEYKGYHVNVMDIDNDYLIGKRGLNANEWKSITGVYYRFNQDQGRIQIYILTKISQDITGGWRENRAKEIGKIVEMKMN